MICDFGCGWLIGLVVVKDLVIVRDLIVFLVYGLIGGFICVDMIEELGFGLWLVEIGFVEVDCVVVM